MPFTTGGRASVAVVEQTGERDSLIAFDGLNELTFRAANAVESSCLLAQGTFRIEFHSIHVERASPALAAAGLRLQSGCRFGTIRWLESSIASGQAL